MFKNTIFSIGVMSGTSLDGLDLVYVAFNLDELSEFKIIYATTDEYSNKWRYTLKTAITYTNAQLLKLDKEYGIFLGHKINEFIANNNITKIDFIASHGHTVLHQPEKGITLQVGSGKQIAELTQHKVVCNFRAQDVKLGGQGAPLVPIGDKLLFKNYTYCLNLGGFSNISFDDNKGNRIAFDICPVNIVLNHFANKLGLAYDKGGLESAKGDVNTSLLTALNSLTYYKLPPPKSLGLEWVKKEVLPLIDGFKLEVKDVLRTFVAHIVLQLAKNITDNSSVLVTGGGAFNTFLIKELQAQTTAKIILKEAQLINYKEALVFSLLGLLKLQNKVNCLKTVTGAAKDHSAGDVYKP